MIPAETKTCGGCGYAEVRLDAPYCSGCGVRHATVTVVQSQQDPPAPRSRQGRAFVSQAFPTKTCGRCGYEETRGGARFCSYCGEQYTVFLATFEVEHGMFWRRVGTTHGLKTTGALGHPTGRRAELWIGSARAEIVNISTGGDSGQECTGLEPERD